MAQSKSKDFDGPRSICTCGHTGDGNNTQHHDLVVIGGVERGVHGGNGICSIPGCKCERFTWKQWTKKFAHFMEISESDKK